METQLGTVQNPGWLILVWGSTVRYMIYIYGSIWAIIATHYRKSVLNQPVASRYKGTQQRGLNAATTQLSIAEAQERRALELWMPPPAKQPLPAQGPLLYSEHERTVYLMLARANT